MPVFTLPKSSHPDFALPKVKPNGPVEIDWDNSLSKGLVVYALLGEGIPHVLYDKFGSVVAGTTGTPIGSSEGRLLSQSTTEEFVTLKQPYDESIHFSAEELTWAARLRRNAAGNQQLSRLPSNLLHSHYPHGGVMYMGIARLPRLTLTGVYDSDLDDTLHNVIVTSSKLTDEYKTYTGGVLRDTTTADWSWGGVRTTDQKLFMGTYKDAGFFALWNRALSSHEVASLEEDPYRLILKPAIPLTYFVPGAAAAGGGLTAGSLSLMGVGI